MKRSLLVLVLALVMVAGMIGTAYAGTNLLTNGDFESSGGFTSDYVFEAVASHTGGAGLGTLDAEGHYGIGSNPNDYHSLWTYGPFEDHSVSGTKMMIVNGSETAGTVVWRSDVVNVIANHKYTFSFWSANIYPEMPTALDLFANGVLVDTYTAPNDYGSGNWHLHEYTWTAGTNTTVQFSLRGSSTAHTGNDYVLDDFSLVDFVVPVIVDIKPMSDPNGINNDGHGVIPVAILGSATFDVMSINPGTVTLDGMAVRFKGKSQTAQASYKDYNFDGFVDLIVQISDTDGAFTSGQTTGNVTGLFWDGGAFAGTDALKIAPAL